MNLTREEIFTAWVPDLPEDELGMPWTSWAKPVLFANLGSAGLPAADNTRSMPFADQTDAPDWTADRFAVVIDLPGPDSVRRGMEFAELGFRLVPLFNGCPGPGEVVDTNAVCSAIENAAPRLRALRFAKNAPPAFLLDSRRMFPTTAIVPGRFDNRWLTFPQDFPSANLLLARGIKRAVLIQSAPGQPQEDLAHVLRRWQEGGVTISVASGPDASENVELDVQKPSRFRSLWYHLRAWAGLFPNSTGGFGGIVPQPSSG